MPNPVTAGLRAAALSAVIGGLLPAAMPVLAQPPEGEDFLAVPETPSGPYPGESVGAPEVTIIETDTQIITEYRVRGRLYLVEIQPVAGPPYFLLDTDGDGILDVQQQGSPDLAVPQWRLFSW